ncbi:SPOR domain-containing protein [bacterium]|nr:MAG: SPOR domain-containing protein [bacterium]
MAEKQDYSQGEFFSSSLESGQFKGHIAKSSFFTRIRGYEKTMLLIMLLVLTSIIAFSLGVEKGKRLAFFPEGVSASSGYTIQVSAFRSREQAGREALILAKKGFSPLAFAKGDYVILCVGRFPNQKSAQPLLNQLQKTYAGCRIRRL